jgi:predicted TIM-barrel enzyme
MKVPWKERLDGIRLNSLADMFGVEKPIIGMVHLWPLPGAPGYAGYGMGTIMDHAQRDAGALLEGGVDGLIVENMWDLPYYVGADVPFEAITAQAVAARAIVEMAHVPVGINVVHNGGLVELAIAVAAGADFIRVCILTGARLWDTGDLEGSRCGEDQALCRRGQEALTALPRPGPGDTHRVDRILPGRCPDCLREDDG